MAQSEPDTEPLSFVQGMPSIRDTANRRGGMFHARILNMKIWELMERDVASCARTDSLNVAARIMWERDCGCVPVVDRNNVVVGMVTDRDICMGCIHTRAIVASDPGARRDGEARWCRANRKTTWSQWKS